MGLTHLPIKMYLAAIHYQHIAVGLICLYQGLPIGHTYIARASYQRNKKVTNTADMTMASIYTVLACILNAFMI